MSILSLPYVACGVLLSYLCIVRALRWRHYHAIHKMYQAKFESGTLTPEEAQKVMALSAFYDMPMLLNYSLAFALFKTYGIPSISKLLASTGQLKSKDSVSRRYADTELLIATWVACPISGLHEPDEPSPLGKEIDPRAMIALARTNWLHSRYKISNDDYLYTLCLFAYEPGTWAKRYGWRSLSPLESHAYYVFWAEIGRRMGIQDIPDTMEDMKAWSVEYEKTHMVPAQSNKDVAKYTTDELLHMFPERFGIKRFFERISVCLLEDTVRLAMMQEQQPHLLYALTWAALTAPGVFQRWFCLPRRARKAPVRVPLPRGEGRARMIPTKHQVRPWYKPQPTTTLGYWRDRLAVSVGFYSEMPGPHLKCNGYRLEEMGPVALEHSGHERVMEIAAELQGCPVPGPWSRKS